MSIFHNEARPPLIWLLLDDRAGNRSQCLGVAEALGFPYAVREISYTNLGALPNLIKGASFTGLTAVSKNQLCAPWPDIVIAAGRRTATVARAIKKKSAGMTKLAQIMYPGDAGLSDFDLVAVPLHDRAHGGANIVPVPGAPHGITPSVLELAAENWRERFADLPSPRIAVIVGGSTRRRTFTDPMGKELGRMVNTMAGQVKGSLLITTSRRSGSAGDAMMTEIHAPNYSFLWGDKGENPYRGYLALADAIVVTGDSVSMCSEACATRSPVYIYAPSGFVVDKHARLHRYLYEQGFARPLNGQLEEWTHPPLNAANEIAAAIRERF